MSNRPKCNNSKSQLLSDQENESVFIVLGKGCFTLATCVAQLFAVQRPRRKHQWIKQCYGVVCFVKDNPKKSYYIRLYDIQRLKMLWEQEIYTKFKYNTPKEFFHTFEAHDCHVGLNFASEDEASVFKEVIEAKLLERQSKRLEREERRIENKPVTFVPVDQTEGTTGVTNTSNQDTKENSPEELPKLRNRKKKKRKLTKEDVGGPSDFRHVSHMSWGQDDGPHLDKLDADMKALLEQIGIKENSEVDNDTMDFIYQFVDKHGGASVVKQDFAWHIPAEPSHPPGEAVDISQVQPAAPSHPAGPATDSRKSPAVPSLSANETHESDRPLPEVQSQTRAHLVPSSRVKVMDATEIIRLPNPEATHSLPRAKPIPPSTKPPPNSRAPPAVRPQPPKTRPPSPTTKPPPKLKKYPAPSPPFLPNNPVSKQSTANTQNTPLSLEISSTPTPTNISATPILKSDVGTPSALSNIPVPPPLPDFVTPLSSANMQSLPTKSAFQPDALSSSKANPLNNSASLELSRVKTSPTFSPLVGKSQTNTEKELPTTNSSRACLLNEIHTFKGVSLRHVQTGHHVSERTELLNQIRTGATLKHVDETEEPTPAKRGSIAAALMSQLLKRKTIIQFSDQEYSSDEFDDDWDDD